MTDQERKAMEMALEALEWHEEQDEEIRYDECPSRAAMDALRQALEQPDVIEAAVRAENEACAKVCEELRDEDGYEVWGVECAAAIRERMK